MTYLDAVRPVSLMLGPATVALAIPLHAELGRLGTMALPLAIALVAGSTVAIASAVALGWCLGASADTLIALAPKSVTMPIAMGVAEKLGGVASLTALTVTLTGVATVMMSRPLLRLLGVEDPAARGFAVGLTGHAIGTAQSLDESEVAGAFAALGMGLNGLATALLVPLLARLVVGR